LQVPAFDKVVFDPACAVGVVHGPVSTSFGSHLILITSRDEPHKAK
jgi:parvulin-like peptidyl-prolyl isomerase